MTATLLPGTGVHGTDSYMTANIHVLNGMTWPGGQLDRTVKDQPFTWAFSPNSPKGGASGDLKQHVAVGSFKLDMTATIGAGGVPTIVSPEATWGWSSTVIAHAVIMGLAWVGALPAGAIIIRFLNNRFPKPAFIHQIVQLSGAGFIFIAFWIGVGRSPFISPFSKLINLVRRVKWTTLQIRTSVSRSDPLLGSLCARRIRLVPSQTLPRGQT